MDQQIEEKLEQFSDL